MVFNSVIFIFYFLPLFLGLYKVSNPRYKKVILLLASILFYAWSGIGNLTFIVCVVCMNYLGYLYMRKHKNRSVLCLLIIINLMVLGYFKYFDYVIDNLNGYLSLQLPIFDLLIPLGISFIIFHIISFHVDCFRNEKLYHTTFIDFALYILLFTKILQGPIILFKDFMRQQDHLDHSFDFFISGIEMFIIGLVQKVIIADTLMVSVKQAIQYMNDYGIDQYTYWYIAIVYYFIIYFDFSGYSNMANGISRLFGYRFENNFHFPYSSLSITNFWRRWHISLGAWFKEYVYIPLGGNRKGNVYVHLIIVFTLTGIWHGAGMLYLLWGLTHGMVILIERVMMKKNLLTKLPKGIRWLYTTVVIIFGWLIFLFPSSSQLLPFLHGMIGNITVEYIPFRIEYLMSFKIIVLLTVCMICSYVLANTNLQKLYHTYNSTSISFNLLKYVSLIILFLFSIMNIISGTYSPFIYFQF